jgi:predicted transcriptional regulator
MASKETRVITAHVPIALAKKIDKLAKQMERPRGWIVKQALAQWAEDEEWKHVGTLHALAQVDRGEVISHEEMLAWVKSLTKKNRKS